jgi:hypothetical protein
LHELRDNYREILRVVLGIVLRWRDVLTVAVSAEIEQNATIAIESLRHEPPDATVAAVAM